MSVETELAVLSRHDSHREVHMTHHLTETTGPDSDTRDPSLYCSLPTRLAGIQDTTPLAWSPCGKFLAFVAGNMTVFISERVGAVFEPRGYLVGHKSHVADIAMHPGGGLLASVSAEGVFLWDVDEIVNGGNGDSDGEEEGGRGNRGNQGNGQGTAAIRSRGMIVPFMRFGVDDSRDAHESAIECCQWMAGGSILLTGGRDGAVKAWDAKESFAFVDTLHAHKAAVLAIAQSPTTGTLATAGRDSTIFLWDVRPLAEEHREKRKEDASYRVGQLYRIDGHRGDIVSLVFTRSGDVLISGARDNEVKVWNISSTKEMMSIKAHKGDVNSLVTMNKDALLLTGAADGLIKLWDLEKIPSLLRVTENFVAEDVNDLLDQDEALVNPEREQAEIVMSCRAHDRDVQAMVVNPKFPLMVTSSSQSCVRVWDIRDLAKPELVHEFVGHDDAIEAVKFIHGDQHFLSAGADYQVYLYDTAQLRRIAALECNGSVHCLALSPLEDIVFAGSTDYAIRAFDIAPARSTTFKTVATFEGHSGKLCSLAVNKDGTYMYSAGFDFDILVWSLAECKGGGDVNNPPIITPKTRVSAHEGRIQGLAINEAGTMLISCGVDHAIGLWSIAKGHRMSKIWRGENAHAAAVQCCVFSKGATSGLFITGSLDHKIKVWDSEHCRSKKGTPLVTLSGHNGRITEVDATKDGKQFISVSADGTARLWAFTTGYPCIAEYVCINDGPVTCLSIGLTSNVFLTGSENSVVRIWALASESNRELFSTERPSQEVIIGAGKKSKKKGKGKEPITAVIAPENGGRDDDSVEDSGARSADLLQIESIRSNAY